MQIDFHHSIIYVLSRLAGFSSSEACVISYASQYVDDAVNSGLIRFKGGPMYSRISSSHKTLDPKNLKAIENHTVWVAFHFLPGNSGEKADSSKKIEFEEKLICRPDSYIARDMIDYCFNDSEQSFALHRLGITLHVLADTFSHEGFSGIRSRINDVDELKIKGKKVSRGIRYYFNVLKSFIVGEIFPLGHGAALNFPDLPYLEWSYKNVLTGEVPRKNPEVCEKAVDYIFDVIVRFRLKCKLPVKNSTIPPKDRKVLLENIRNFTDEDVLKRNKKWIDSIGNGQFSFGGEQICYIEKECGSWKCEALGTNEIYPDPFHEYDYDVSFLSSNWKLFHDALQRHRLDVVHQILPKYGICVA